MSRSRYFHEKSRFPRKILNWLEATLSPRLSLRPPRIPASRRRLPCQSWTEGKVLAHEADDTRAKSQLRIPGRHAAARPIRTCPASVHPNIISINRLTLSVPNPTTSITSLLREPTLPLSRSTSSTSHGRQGLHHTAGRGRGAAALLPPDAPRHGRQGRHRATAGIAGLLSPHGPGHGRQGRHRATAGSAAAPVLPPDAAGHGDGGRVRRPTAGLGSAAAPVLPPDAAGHGDGGQVRRPTAGHGSDAAFVISPGAAIHGRQGRRPGAARGRAGTRRVGETGHAADGPAGGPWGAPREPAGGAVDGLARRPGAAAVRHHGGTGASAGGVGAADGQGDQGRPHGAHPRLLQHLEPQGRGALLQHLAQPQDGAVHVGRGDGEAEPGRQGHHGGRLREAVQADLRLRPRRAREEDVRLLPVHGHGPRRRHALPHQHERGLLQRPPALLRRAVRPDRLELLQDHDPAGQARHRRARHGQGEPAGEVHPHRHRGLARLLVHGLRQLRQGRAPSQRGRLVVAAPRRRSRRGAGAGTHLRVIG